MVSFLSSSLFLKVIGVIRVTSVVVGCVSGCQLSTLQVF